VILLWGRHSCLPGRQECLPHTHLAERDVHPLRRHTERADY
jgi:hypothetical protein